MAFIQKPARRTQTFPRIIALSAMLFLVCTWRPCLAFSVDSTFIYIYRNFEFLPDFHLDADLFTFFLHKNNHFREQYYLETNTNLDLCFLSFRDIVYSVWYFEFQTGMGKTPYDVVFDPNNINFGIVPVFEFRFPAFNSQIGLNHHCFHEIDRKEYSTVYWNKLLLSAGSPNMRISEYWSRLAAGDGWTLNNRISWYLTWGYYIRKFFGIVRESKINGENKNVHDFSMDLRYAFYRRNSWILDARGKATVGYYKQLSGQPAEHGAYWRYDVSIESMFRRGRRGGTFFIMFTLDDLPKYQGLTRFSKDRLLQVGVRFFN